MAKQKTKLTISVKAVFVIMTVISIIIAGLVSFLLTHLTAVSSVRSTIEDLRGTVVGQLEENTTAFMNTAVRETQSIGLGVERRVLNLTAGNVTANLENVSSFLCGVALDSDGLLERASLQFLEDSVSLACRQQFGTSQVYVTYQNGNSRNVTQKIFTVEAYGRRSFVSLPSNPEAPESPMNASDPALTGLVFDDGPSIVGLDTPILGVTGPLTLGSGAPAYGTYGAAVLLTSLEDSTKNVISKFHQKAAVIHGASCTILANSWGEPVVLGNAVKRFLKVAEGSDHAFKDAVSSFGANAMCTADHASFTYDHSHGTVKDTLLVDVRRLTGIAYSSSVRVVTIIDEADFLNDMNEPRNAAIGVVIVTSALLTVCVFALGTAISRPMERLQHNMALTASLRDSEDDDNGAVFSEIARMEQAYVEMRKQLNRCRSFLPQSVVRDGEADDEDSTSGLPPSVKAINIEAELENLHEESAAMERSVVVSGNGSGNSGGNGETNGATNGKTPAREREWSVMSSVRRRDVRSSMAGNINKWDRASSRRGSTMSDQKTIVGLEKGTKLLNLDTKVNSSRVTILALDTSGFHRNENTTQTSRRQRDLVKAVLSSVNEYRGVIDFFQGDRFVVSFNAVAAVPSQHKRAILLANKLNTELLKRGVQPYIGVDSGQALVGNMGTSDLKRFCILGECYSRAIKLREICKDLRTRYGAKCHTLFNEDLLDENAIDIFAQAVEVFPGSERPIIVFSLEGNKSNSGIADEIIGGEEEVTADPYFHGNEAIRAFADGDTKAARDIAVRHLSGNPTSTGGGADSSNPFASMTTAASSRIASPRRERSAMMMDMSVTSAGPGKSVTDAPGLFRGRSLKSFNRSTNNVDDPLAASQTTDNTTAHNLSSELSPPHVPMPSFKEFGASPRARRVSLTASNVPMIRQSVSGSMAGYPALGFSMANPEESTITLALPAALSGTTASDSQDMLVRSLLSRLMAAGNLDRYFSDRYGISPAELAYRRDTVTDFTGDTSTTTDGRVSTDRSKSPSRSINNIPAAGAYIAAQMAGSTGSAGGTEPHKPSPGSQFIVTTPPPSATDR